MSISTIRPDKAKSPYLKVLKRILIGLSNEQIHAELDGFYGFAKISNAIKYTAGCLAKYSNFKRTSTEEGSHE